MAVILNKLKDSLNYVFYDIYDERTKDMFPSATFMFTVLPIYYYLTNHLGPRIMKNRKPMKLKNTIMFYNIFQILISAYLTYQGLFSGWLNGYSWTCQSVDYTESPNVRGMINAVWLYTIVKLIDLFDTVFFVLRKKDNQITFLHIFHHTVMPLAAWIALKYFPNGHGTFLGVINSFVHVIMYTYYFISGLGPEYQKYLWWKKHLTSLQIIQFVMIFIHNIIPLFESQCSYPKWIHSLLCIHSLQFIYLFGSFYYSAYILKPKRAQNRHANSISKITKSN